MEKCDLCDFVGGKRRSDTVCTVKSDAIETIRKASRIRQDNAEVLFKGKTTVQLHVGCRNFYTKHPKPPTQDPEDVCRSRSQSGEAVFNFKEQCFLCAKTVDVYHPDRKPWCQVTFIKFIFTIRKYASARNDDWGKKVELRLSGVSDLVAVEGRYHVQCYDYFKRPGSCIPGIAQNLGKKEDPKKKCAFEFLCQELEKESVDCQFTLKSLKHIMEKHGSGEVYSEKHLKSKLSKKYGDAITFTELTGERCVVCFTGVAHRILNDSWYREKCSDPEEEKVRIISTAAKLIQRDIKLRAYDDTVYPSVEDMTTGGQDLIPKSLQIFLEGVVCDTNAKKSDPTRKRKIMSIAHSIVSAVRPRYFLSPLHICLSVALHRRCGSRFVIDVLHSLGVCTSYQTATKYEKLLSETAPATIDPGAYVQVVFDNADHNVNTLSGHGTFHAMGGVMCVTPKSALNPSTPVLRSTQGNVQSSSRGFLPVTHYFDPGCNGYSKIIAKDISTMQLSESSFAKAVSVDILWSSGLWTGALPRPGWSGYMETVYRKMPYVTTSVTPLPFVNLAPTNPSSIYTALLYAADLCERQNQSYIIVSTFFHR